MKCAKCITIALYRNFKEKRIRILIAIMIVSIIIYGYSIIQETEDLTVTNYTFRIWHNVSGNVKGVYYNFDKVGIFLGNNNSCHLYDIDFNTTFIELINLTGKNVSITQMRLFTRFNEVDFCVIQDRDSNTTIDVYGNCKIDNKISEIC